MTNFRTYLAAAVICGGVFALCGCQHSATLSNGIPIPPPHAAPSVQAQIQQIESDPHIPAAQKAGMEAQIVSNNKSMTDKTPVQKP